MSATSFILATTLPFIPDGNPPTETTSGANTTAPAATQAPVTTTVSRPEVPGQPLVVVTLAEDNNTVSTTTAVTSVTSANSETTVSTTAEDFAVATNEQGSAVTSVDPEGETVVIATNTVGESVAVTTTANSADEVAVATTTVLVQPDGTVSTGFESESSFVAETEQIIATETEEFAAETQSSTSFIPWLIGIVVVLLAAGALVVIPRLKKFK